VRLSALRANRSLLPRNIFYVSGTHFCQRLSRPQGLVRLEGLGKLNKFNDQILTIYSLLATSSLHVYEYIILASSMTSSGMEPGSSHLITL
jgi:hypothetical protein